MKKLFFISLFILSYTTQSFTTDESITKTVKTRFWVNGVCGMCQDRIQKAALSTKGVKMAKWNIESKMLTVIYKDTSCSLDDIKKSIAAVGHDTVEFKATDEVYNNLHGCCKYDREATPEHPSSHKQHDAPQHKH